MLVLGIETSCDETAFALYDSVDGLLGHIVHSQVELHNKYGGVVPELASRDHIRKCVPLLTQLLSQSRRSLDDVDGVAYTAGPGLLGALMVGACFGRSLAWALKVPSLAVHHMEAHLLAPLIESSDAPPFPYIALLVSGGHTQLLEVTDFGIYTLLGESLDDAAGEAFDKVAKMLGLAYPGGPAIAALGQKGNPERFRFPRPMTDRPGLDFSFSGLKTYTLNTINNFNPITDQDKADIALAFELAVVDTLYIKCRRAIETSSIPHLVMAGGVAANKRLRSTLRQKLSAKVYYPSQEFCTDNGAMIAHAGMLRMMGGERSGLSINTRARWPLDELSAIKRPAR